MGYDTTCCTLLTVVLASGCANITQDMPAEKLFETLRPYQESKNLLGEVVEASSRRDLPVLLLPDRPVTIQVLDAEKQVLRSWPYPGW